MRLSLRTELRVFAVCIVLIFVIDYGTGGINAWSPWAIDPTSPLQSRLLPALLLYLLTWGVRLLLALTGSGDDPPSGAGSSRPQRSRGSSPREGGEES